MGSWLDKFITPETETLQQKAARRFAGWGFTIGPCGQFQRHPKGHPQAGRVVWDEGAPVIESFVGKEPLLRHGKDNFTNDTAQVAAWWEKWPEANIGARPPANIVVLDIDPRNGGDETWEEYNHGHTLPATFTTRTGSGGRHFWYRRPYAGQLRGQAGPGVDVKHNGGYLIMPGSIHPATGSEYFVEQWVAPADWPVLPQHLRKHVYRPPAAPKPVIPINLQHHGDGSGLVAWLAERGPGERNNALYWAACTALDEGYDILDDLAAAAEHIGLPTAEVEATLRSAQGAARQEGRTA